MANLEEESARLRLLRDRLYAGLAAFGPVSPTVSVEGGAVRIFLPNIVHVLVDGLESETMILRLDMAGIGVSGGSACSSHSLEPSHVLKAMGVSGDPRVRRSAHLDGALHRRFRRRGASVGHAGACSIGESGRFAPCAGRGTAQGEEGMIGGSGSAPAYSARRMLGASPGAHPRDGVFHGADQHPLSFSILRARSRGEVIDYVREADRAGLATLAFTEHYPLTPAFDPDEYLRRASAEHARLHRGGEARP